jgi:hypothetical protein
MEFIGGGRGRPPLFLAVLIGSLFVGCFLELFIELRGWLETLRLSSGVWERFELWRLVTYGWVGAGTLSPITLIEIVLVYWFATELTVWIGSRRTQLLLVGGVPLAGAAATAVQWLWTASGGSQCADPFVMMQGQRIVIAVVVAAFASCNRGVIIKRLPFFFHLPIPSRWLIPLQLLWALMVFANTRDLAGFAGVVLATALGWVGANAGGSRSDREPRASVGDHG